jgi:predicted Zn-dependent peptidase
MTSTVTTLPNGLRVVTHAMPHVETSSLGVWIGVGARHETIEQQGISHLLEHMAFKGTAKRSAMQIAEEIEHVGGEINAATSLETTAYYARVLKGDEGLALEILADILQNSAFDPAELDREREVILQEIAATQDSPDEIAYDLIQDVAFPNQAVGRAILGTPESVTATTAGDLRAFLKANYQPGRMIVSAAGAVSHDVIERHARALFGGLSADNGPSVVEEAATYVGGAKSSAKAFEQSHILMGFEGPSYRDDQAFTAQVFSGLFGGGMSSRLFQEVREKRGLCYSIYSAAWGLKDSGMFQIHAATGHGMVSELIDVIGVELATIARDGPTEREVVRAKAQLKAGLLMSLESSGARAEQMARHLLIHGRLLEPHELVAKVDAVTADGVRLFAQRLANSPPCVAVVGSGKKSAGHAKHAARAMGDTTAATAITPAAPAII